MTIDEWVDEFFAALHAMMGLGGTNTVVVGSGGARGFGNYQVIFRPPKQASDSFGIAAVESAFVSGATAVDAMRWTVTTEDDPLETAQEVARWLKPRVRR